MNVNVGAEWQTASGSYRKYEACLSEDDLIGLTEGASSEWGFKRKWDYLNAYAETLVINYMQQEEYLTSDAAEESRTKVKQRLTKYAG
jgi:hypothetical protein